MSLDGYARIPSGPAGGPVREAPDSAGFFVGALVPIRIEWPTSSPHEAEMPNR